MYKKINLTYEEVKELFDYEPVTGTLYWKNPRGKKIKPGSVAGCQNDIGYMKVKINYKDYKVHRVIWLWYYGTYPEDGFDIDHINWNKADNRISNLRLLPWRENRKHKKPRNPKKEVTGVP